MSESAYRRRPHDGRTMEQREANMLDCDLYRLISRVSVWEAGAKGDSLQRWQNTRTSMNQARVYVRAMMHPDDRKGTEGRE